MTIQQIKNKLNQQYNTRFIVKRRMAGRTSLPSDFIIIKAEHGQNMPLEFLNVFGRVMNMPVSSIRRDMVSVTRAQCEQLIEAFLPQPMPDIQTNELMLEELMPDLATEATSSPYTQNEAMVSATTEPLNNTSQTPHVEAESDEETDSWTCADCEETFEGTEPDHELNDKFLCNSCRDNYFSCDNCSVWFNRDDENYTSTDSSMYCENCATDCSYYCEGCETTYDGDDYYEHNGSYYCSDCYHDRYYDCEGCGNSYSSGDGYYCEDCGADYCSECWDSHEHNEDGLTPEQREERERTRTEAQRNAIAESRLRNPYRKPSIDFFEGTADVGETRFIKHKRFVGIEIEAEKGDIYGLGTEVPEEVGISTDGSLSDKGVELQTPPASLEKLETFVEKTCEALQKKGYKGTKSSGLHVHIDARDIRNDHKKLTQVIKTFYAVEDMLYSMLPPSRWASHYCKRLSQGYLYNNFRTNSDVKSLQKEWYKAPQADDEQLNRHIEHKYDDARYFGLNIHSVFFRGTIELRYHSGTINPVKILQWTNLCLRLMDWALTSYDEKLIEKLFQMETGYEKYRLFKEILNMPYELASYIDKRINKFNPNFVVKFNKGKKIRATERKQLTRKKKHIEQMVIKCHEQRLKELKEYWRRETAMGWSNPPSSEALETEARRYAESSVRESLPQDLRELLADGGFIHDSEIRTIQSLMQTGRQLQEANTQEGEVDIEE